MAGCSEAPATSPETVDAEVAGDGTVSDVGAERDAGRIPDGGAALDVGPDRVPIVATGGSDSGPADVPAILDRGPADVPVILDRGPDVGARDVGATDLGARDVGMGDVGLADARAADVGTADAGSLPAVGPALPAWDGATVAHVREVRTRGVSLGNRLTVFAKIGDSITESGSFLSDVGFGWVDLGAYTALAPTITYFQMTGLGGTGINSFNRASVCATAGWTSDDALAGGSTSPFRRELAAIHPAWAIVMYGTNDIDRSSLTMFRANLNTIIDIAEAAGTVVALSTIPDRTDGAGPAAQVPLFNDAIRALTAARHIPLLDYWAAMQPLPSHGISVDHIHPSVLLSGGSTAPGYFTVAGLGYGYNMRNLTAIQMLDRLRSLP